MPFKNSPVIERNKTLLNLPFKEEWTTTWGGDTKALNYPKSTTNWQNTCFVKGTKITMNNGRSKNIEDIKVGDQILSVNMETFKIESDIVQVIPESIEFYNKIKLQFDNDVVIYSSPHHPFYVKNKGWSVFDMNMAKKDLNFKIFQLEVGDIVYYYSEGKLKEIKLTKLINTDERVEMYNIKYVKKNNTFFANGVLVHNRYNN